MSAFIDSFLTCVLSHCMTFACVCFFFLNTQSLLSSHRLTQCVRNAFELYSSNSFSNGCNCYLQLELDC